MSVDGEILTDLKRLMYLRPPAALFFLVVGPDGSGKSEVLHSILTAAPNYNIEVLHCPKDCFAANGFPSGFSIPSSYPISVNPPLVPSLSIFYVNFYELQKICEEFTRRMDTPIPSTISHTAEGRAQELFSTGSSSYLREGLIILMDDLQSLWEVASWHGITPKLHQFLKALRATPQSALVTTAVSETSLPLPILSSIPFVSYPIPFPMTIQSSRLYLRPFMVHSLRSTKGEKDLSSVTGSPPTGISCEMVHSIQDRMTNALCRILPQCIQPMTTKRSMLMALSMGTLRVMNAINLVDRGILPKCCCEGDVGGLGNPCLHELQETKLALREYLRRLEMDDSNSATALGEKSSDTNNGVVPKNTSVPHYDSAYAHDQSVQGAQPPPNDVEGPLSSWSRGLYGLEGILDRLVMIVKVFLAQNSKQSSFPSPTRMSNGDLGYSMEGALIASIPSATGVLLYGPSGCGKSSLAYRLRHIFPQVSFFFIRCSSLFGKYLGESERRLRDVYAKARSTSPAIVVLDEIDVIALSRGAMQSGEGNNSWPGGTGANVSKRMLAALLCELDGLTSNEGVLTVGTTNAPHVIDPAILRQGRLETLLFVPPLTLAAAENMASAVLQHFGKGVDCKNDSELEGRETQEKCIITQIASATEGCAPACLDYVLRQVVEKCVLSSLSLEDFYEGSSISPRLPATEEISSILKNAIQSGILKPVEEHSSFLAF